MLTKVVRNKMGWITKVNGKPAPEHLRKIRIPPAWKSLQVDPDPSASLVAVGFDSKGRKQYLYSQQHVLKSKSAKFAKIRQLIQDHEEIRSMIEEDINDRTMSDPIREAALVAYLIFETGIRPGSTQDTKGDVPAYGATTLQLRHVQPTERGVRLKFPGKRGIKQSVSVTNPHIVEELRQRKEDTTSWSSLVFECTSHQLRQYIKSLGDYTPKDLRTMRGTMIAMDIIGSRVRIPKTKKDRKKVVNDMLDKVAKQLGNTRAITKSAYVDPDVYDRFLGEEK